MPPRCLAESRLLGSSGAGCCFNSMCASICSDKIAALPQRSPKEGVDLELQLSYLRSEAAAVRASLQEAGAQGGARFTMLAACDVLVRQLRWVAASQRLTPQRAVFSPQLSSSAWEARVLAFAWAAAWAHKPGAPAELCARAEYLCALAGAAAVLQGLEGSVGEAALEGKI